VRGGGSDSFAGGGGDVSLRNREPPRGTISIYFGGKSWFGTSGAKRLYVIIDDKYFFSFFYGYCFDLPSNPKRPIRKEQK
jgi:hypothetical protein